MRFNSLLLLGFASVVTSQTSPISASALDLFPQCAQLCFLEAFGAGLCLPTDPTCMCTNQEFQFNVTVCVDATCTIPEALSTQNTSLTTCGAPVRERSKHLAAHSLTMECFAMLFIAMRVFYKLYMKMQFGMDDIFVFATATLTIPQIIILLRYNIPNGLGRDIWTLQPEQITNFLKFWYIVAIIYFIQTCLIKLAFISFYMRIFTAKHTKRLLWGTFIFVLLWGAAFVVVAIFVCTPITYMWTQWDGLHAGQCVNDAAYVWTNAAINIALDFWIIAIPLWELRKLKLHWKKKVGVVCMFCLGAFVTVMSILRLKSLVYYMHRANVTWEFVEISLWSSIEIGVGIICACLPTLRLMLVKIWPVLSGSTNRRSDQWYQSGKGSDRCQTPSSRGQLSPIAEYGVRKPQEFGRVVTVDSRNRTMTEKSSQESGIGMEKSFTVHYNEGSDISLVVIRGDPRNLQRQW